MMDKLIYMACLVFLLNSANGQLYVSPNGNDTNPGTKEAPLATLTGARDAVRILKSTSPISNPITVIIADGYYEMNEPLVLTPSDSGTEESPVIYKAEKGANPVFSGGEKITGFKVNESGIWEVKIRDFIKNKSRFDQLYVDGQRATLARTPNKGFLGINKIEENILEKGTGRVAEKAQQVLTFDDESFQALNQINENEIDLVRFRAYHKWDFTLRSIDKIEKDGNQVITSGKGMKPWNPLKKGGRIIFENYAAALDNTGEWFLTSDGILNYIPQTGQTPDNTEVIVPKLENLITIKGDTNEEDFVENIHFEGISFKHCSYLIPQSGSEPNQAAALINAAIMIEGGKNIQFINCEISQTGQHALWFGKGCSNCNVEHCYLNNLGGGGIYLGDFSASEAHTHRIRILNNIIQSGGQEFPSAVGIWVGHSSDNDVSFNDIGNFYYTGISVGWTWGYGESYAKRNNITYNHIHHIGWDLLSDMAAVYTLGKSEGTVISNNVIHHVHAYSYGGWGLYPDEGSSGIVMENNLVYSTKTGGFHQHYGKENIIRNNIFAFSKLYQAQCTRVEDHRSFNFENNILVFNEGVVLQGAWEKIDIKMDNNLYWNIADDTYIFNKKTFTKWQKTGHDSNSIIANPNFKDASNFNFEITNKINSNKIGFVPFDYSNTGVYGDKHWTEKAKLPRHILTAFDEAVEENMR